MPRFLALASALLLSLASARAEDVSYQPDDARVLSQCQAEMKAQSEAGGSGDLTDCIGAATSACELEAPENQSTFGMMRCAQRETTWWDEQLNMHYQALRAELPEGLFAELRAAQRAWIAYRDASCGFEYRFWEDGSIRHIIYSGCVLRTAALRALDLDGLLGWMDR